MRLGDRLNVVLDFASDTLHAQVPHLLLQPLVENAIKHGVSKISSPGEVSVLTTREDGRLHLMITDNGPGLGVTPKASSGGGLGLRATQERLRTLYGSNQRLEIRSKPGDGVEVSVEIPFRAAMLEQQEVVGL
jgi:two-component system LytT family sensor kinase